MLEGCWVDTKDTNKSNTMHKIGTGVAYLLLIMDKKKEKKTEVNRFTDFTSLCIANQPPVVVPEMTVAVSATVM